LTRYRTKLVQERRRAVNRVQGVLERANITLASVASDVMGVSGRAMLDAWSAGRADPATMAEWARGRMRSKLPALAQALTGVVRDHHRLLLATQLAPIDVLDEQSEALSRAIVERMQALELPAPSGVSTGLAGTASAASTAPPPEPVTFARAVELLDTIPGVDQWGAELLVAELGIDMARFGTAARLAAWSGVAPGNDESAGKQRSGKTRQGNGPLRAGLTPLAPAAARTKGTYLSALYYRLAARRGKKRASMAVAHSMVVSVFPLLSRNQPDRELGANYFDEPQRQHVVDRLTRRIERLGYHLRHEALSHPAA
jgi:transposase